MTAAVLQLPGCAPRKVKQEGRARAGKLAGVPSLNAIREARKVAVEKAKSANIVSMRNSLVRMLGAVASGELTGLTFIEARSADQPDSVTISGSFIKDHAHLQRCLDAFSGLLYDHAAQKQS